MDGFTRFVGVGVLLLGIVIGQLMPHSPLYQAHKPAQLDEVQQPGSGLRDGQYVVEVEVQEGLYYNYVLLNSGDGIPQQQRTSYPPGRYEATLVSKGGYVEIAQMEQLK